MLTIGVIGAGNMASALIGGLSNTLFDDAFITVWDINREKLDEVVEIYQVKAAESIAEAVEADILLLAVKPNNMKALLEEIAPLVRVNQPVVSVAAGITLDFYAKYLPEACIVRAMPNTSCAVLHSVTGLMSERALTADERGLVEMVFNAVGKCVWIDEEDVHALIAVSGSGPAYFYYFCEEMARVGAELGLDEDVAAMLAKETMIGAGKMLASSEHSPETLRKNITSPNGTTEQAILSFSRNLPLTMERAMSACAERSKEMAEEK